MTLTLMLPATGVAYLPRQPYLSSATTAGGGLSDPKFQRSSTGVSTTVHLTGPEVIDSAVAFDTFVPQPFWLLMVASPRSDLTRAVMGSIVPILLLSLVHLVVVLLAATAPG